MATQSWSTRIRHDSDAVYQEWRDEFIAKLALLLRPDAARWLVADETTITTGAGARAGVNSEAEYAVFHLNDSLHGTAPVYFRFGFGTGSVTNVPRIQLTIGTSTNGSGVLGGTALISITNLTSGVSSTTDTARQSYFSANDGFLGINWKTGVQNLTAAMVFCRSCDASGSPTATAAYAVIGDSGSTSFARSAHFRFASPAAIYTTTSATIGNHSVCVLPLAGAIASTIVGSDIQAALCVMYTPRIQPIFGMVGVINTEATSLSTFQATPVGTTTRTYLVMERLTASDNPNIGNGLWAAMLWE